MASRESAIFQARMASRSRGVNQVGVSVDCAETEPVTSNPSMNNTQHSALKNVIWFLI